MWQAEPSVGLLNLAINGAGPETATVNGTYDAAGNLITYAPPSATLLADYDSENRVVKTKRVDPATGAETSVDGEYFYGGEGLRITMPGSS